MPGAILVVSALCVLATAWILNLLNTIWWVPKRLEKELRRQGIYGPQYRLMYGNTKEMMQMAKKEAESKPKPLNHDILPRLNPFLHNMVITYKDIFVIWFGTTARVMIMDMKLIKELMMNKSGDFIKPELNSFAQLFVNGFGTYNGEKWAKHRKIVAPAFHIDKLKGMVPAFSTCSDEMIKRWDTIIGPTGSSELDIAVEFHNLAGDAISRAAFGSSFEEGRLIFSLQKEQCELFLRSSFHHVFPLLRFLPTKSNKRMRHIYNKVRGLLRGIIEKRERALRSGISDNNDDLLGLLLKSNLNHHEFEENKRPMTIEEVIEECKLFYFAGQDTTSNLLTWTLVSLSMHTHWQEQARSEVLHVIGKRTPSFNDLNQLKTITMILQEVLRLYPPSALTRSTHKRTKLGNFYLPTGVQITIPLHVLHRDPELWGEDSLDFNPERFSEGVSKASKDHIYFPFGWGPRICIGQNFAMIEAKLALTKILQHFTFELSPSYCHAPTMLLTLQPKYGAQIILRRL